MPFAAIWMELEIVILSQVTQTEKDRYHDITCTWNLKKMVQINVFKKQKQSYGCRKQTQGQQGEREEG